MPITKLYNNIEEVKTQDMEQVNKKLTRDEASGIIALLGGWGLLVGTDIPDEIVDMCMLEAENRKKRILMAECDENAMSDLLSECMTAIKSNI